MEVKEEEKEEEMEVEEEKEEVEIEEVREKMCDLTFSSKLCP